MASFSKELPLDLIQELEELGNGSEKMFGEMTKAGAEKVYANVKNNIKRSFKDSSQLEQCLKITKTYKSSSDDGINTKIGIYGYINKGKTFKQTKMLKGRFNRINNKPVAYKETYTYDGTPAPLVANAREYGTSRGEQKKPFFRKSFKKKEIEETMLEVQKKYIKGD